MGGHLTVLDSMYSSPSEPDMDRREERRGGGFDRREEKGGGGLDRMEEVELES